MKLGDLSRLAEKIGEKHNFDTSWKEHKDWCCAYMRDRGDRKSPAEKSSKDEFLELAEAYTYLFEDGKWLVMSDEDGGGFNDLLHETTKERLTA